MTTIINLTELAVTAVDHSSDMLVINDDSANTDKKISVRSVVGPQVYAPASGTTMTPDCTKGTMSSLVCTESAGTLTIGSAGTGTDGQLLVIRVECTNAQDASWNGVYRAAATTPGALPTTGAFGAGKINYFAFRYHLGDSVWDYIGFSGAFTAT